MNAIIQVIIIILCLILGMCVICIPLAFLLLWLDEKGIIEKIVNVVKRKEKEK